MSLSMNTPIDEILGRSNPAKRALGKAGYQSLKDLEGASEKELLALHGFGPKGIRILREALAAAGLSFNE